MKTTRFLYLLLLSLLVFGDNFICAQTVLNPTWMQMDSSSNGLSEAWGVDVDQDGNIYWAVSSDELGQGLDIYVHKFEKGGKPAWSQPAFFGGPGTQHAYVCNARDGSDLYVGGRLCSGLVTTCDMLLLQIDKQNGEVNWDRRLNFSADGYDEVDGLEIRPDGIYCGGWSQEFDGSIYRSDIGLWKLDLDGNSEWTNYLGVPETAEHQDGHFVVDEDHIYAAGLWGGKGIANLYNGHSFLGKFDRTDGELVDSTLFGHQANTFNDIENALGMTSDGEFLYVTGYTTLPGSNDWQIFVAKFDKNLNQLWFVDWGGEGSESARGIAIENDVIYVAGLTESESIMTGGERDAVLLQLDTDGNLLNYQTYGSELVESFQDITVANKNIYLTGTMESGLSNKASMLLALEDVSSTYKASHNYEFSVFPNPCAGPLTLQSESNELKAVRIFDEKGAMVENVDVHSFSGKRIVYLNRPGVYFIQAEFPNYRTTRKVMCW